MAILILAFIIENKKIFFLYFVSSNYKMSSKKKGKFKASSSRRSQQHTPNLPPEIQDIIANFTRDVNVQNTITTDYMRRRLRNERLQPSISRPYLYQIPRYRSRPRPGRIPNLRSYFDADYDDIATAGRHRAEMDVWEEFELNRLFRDIYNDEQPQNQNLPNEVRNILAWTYYFRSGDRNPRNSPLTLRGQQRGRLLDNIETNPRTLRRRSGSRKRPLSAPVQGRSRRRSAPFRNSFNFDDVLKIGAVI
jgi:hypothetical protein